MNLKLTRPLVFFDLETTGTDRTKDRITQYCFHVFWPDGGNQIFESLVNPEMPIPPIVSELTGITDERVKDLAPFAAHAETVLQIVQDADIVGFGCLMFDVPLLFSELHRAGLVWDYTRSRIIDAGNIYKRNVPRDLSSALLFYTGKRLTNAHSAKADVDATREVFLFQLEKHGLTQDLEQLSFYSNYDRHLVDLSGKFAYNDKGEVILNFSAKKGEKAKDNIGLLHWMLAKDFSEDVKIICRDLIRKHDIGIGVDMDNLPF